LFRDPLLVAPWTALVAFLMVSNLATLSWGRMRPRSDLRIAIIAVVGMVFAALLLEPWWTLAAICFVYLATMPWSIARYARIRRQRAAAPVPAPFDAATADLH
jgi:CDP-diacylglycerol--serine O-phosphatidyltransferase